MSEGSAIAPRIGSLFGCEGDPDRRITGGLLKPIDTNLTGPYNRRALLVCVAPHWRAVWSGRTHPTDAAPDRYYMIASHDQTAGCDPLAPVARCMPDHACSPLLRTLPPSAVSFLPASRLHLT